MKKYLVDLYVPAAGRHYDVYLPAGKHIWEVIQLLVGMTASLSGGSFQGTKDAILLNGDNGLPLERNVTVFDAGIRSASKLILI